MSIKYSVSKIGCYNGCPKQYDLSYVQGYYLPQENKDIKLRKGSAFHEFAELYDKDWDDVTCKFKQDEMESKYDIVSQYDLTNPIKVFKEFWNSITEGAEFVERELRVDYVMDGFTFVGAIDVIIKTRDGKWIIIDWKSSKASPANKYSDQLLSYIIAVCQKYNLDIKEAENNIEVGLFFPFEDIPKRGGVNSLFKTLKYSYHDIETLIAINSETIKEIETKPKKNANISYQCSWCNFVSSTTKEGKSLCEESRKMGIPRVRGLYLIQKEKK